MAKSPTTRVRVLSALVIAGVTYRPNAVLELPNAIAKGYVKEGQADDAPEAVDYALSEGAEVVTPQLEAPDAQDAQGDPTADKPAG